MAIEAKNPNARPVEYRTRIGTGEMISEQEKALVRGFPEGDKTVVMLGTVFGKAHGVSWRKNNFSDDIPASALMGIFEFIPSVIGRSILRAPALFLPASAQAIAVAAVSGGKPPPSVPKRGASVDAVGDVVLIEFEIGVRKDANAVGYAFVSNGKRELSQTDELAEMRAMLTSSTAKQIAAPVSDKQIDAPITGKRK